MLEIAENAKIALAQLESDKQIKLSTLRNALKTLGVKLDRETKRAIRKGDHDEKMKALENAAAKVREAEETARVKAKLEQFKIESRKIEKLARIKAEGDRAVEKAENEKLKLQQQGKEELQRIISDGDATREEQETARLRIEKTAETLKYIEDKHNEKLAIIAKDGASWTWEGCMMCRPAFPTGDDEVVLPKGMSASSGSSDDE